MASEDASSLIDKKTKTTAVEASIKKKGEGEERGGRVGAGAVDVPTVIDRMGSLVLAVKGDLSCLCALFRNLLILSYLPFLFVMLR